MDRRVLYLLILGCCVMVQLDALKIDQPFVKEVNTSYLVRREALLTEDSSTMLGYDITLSPDEKDVNELLMMYKNEEYSTSFNTTNFPPAINFLQSKPQIDESLVFKFIQQMPKGSVLHVHDLSTASVDWVISNITYWDNLYICNLTEDQIIFRFFLDNIDQTCEWKLVSDVRVTYPTNEDFDDYLKQKLSLITPFPNVKYPDINGVWMAFEKVFIALDGLLSYTEAIKAYIYQALTEFLNDNISYYEFRGVLSLLYELNGTILTAEQTVGIYKEVADNFLLQNPSFYGVRYIYAPPRLVSNEQVEEYVDLVIRLMDLYPDFVVGFDLVGQEDLGRPLVDFIDSLLRLGEHDPPIPVFYHAGETNWEGTSTDENIFDALLLNSTRIGHGYAIIKHPALMNDAISRNIPIEVCPLSNQVLMLVEDLRNHPAVALAAKSFPLVISSDDPNLWDALPLSHDFYAAFMAIGGAHADLKFLKKLALNSIQYSALDQQHKDELSVRWLQLWTNFISSQLKPRDEKRIMKDEDYIITVKAIS